MLSTFSRAEVLLPDELSTGDDIPDWQTVGGRATRVAVGADGPTFLVTPPNDPNRLFITELTRGWVRLFDKESGELQETPFLVVEDMKRAHTETGLLGMVFDPQFGENGYFYIYFTDEDINTHIRRYSVSADNPNLADPDSGVTILKLTNPQTNHHAGWMDFGPEGYLYAAIGDGGGGNDLGPGHSEETGNAQDLSNLLGKIIRIDVRSDDFPDDPLRNYSVPLDNPFVEQEGAAPEIWVYGLRNPWRNSFDPETGDLYIGDVGQNFREEINVIPGGSGGGQNFGWRLREGTEATSSGGVGGDRPEGAIDPIYEYMHGTGPTEGRSLTGGYVYRGPIKQLQGKYFFADFISNRIWSLEYDGSDPVDFDGTNYANFTDWTSALKPDVGRIRAISSFSQDSAGNLYILNLFDDAVYQIVTSVTRLYRSYNPNADMHFFTTSYPEFEDVVARGYEDEATDRGGVGVLNFPIDGSTPIYRLYNPNTGQHYLSIGEGERDFLVFEGWNDEGTIGYVYPNQLPGTDEIFRLYNVNTGIHLFTTDPLERLAIIEKYPDIWVAHDSLGFGFSQAYEHDEEEPSDEEDDSGDESSNPPPPVSAVAAAVSLPVMMLASHAADETAVTAEGDDGLPTPILSSVSDAAHLYPSEIEASKASDAPSSPVQIDEPTSTTAPETNDPWFTLFPQTWCAL